MLDSIGVDQPEWSALTSIPEALAFADRVSHHCAHLLLYNTAATVATRVGNVAAVVTTAIITAVGTHASFCRYCC
jgi:hypothetical protein